MKANVTMKALSIAVLGLAGVAFAGSSMAACGSDPSVAGGGAWSAKQESDGTIAIATGGALSTECQAKSRVTTTAGSLAAAVVRDDTPTNEARYRAQFYINNDALTSFSGLQGAQVFQVQAAAAGASGSRQMLRAIVVPGGANGKRVRFQIAGAPAAIQGASIDLANGWNRVQVDLTTGAAGTVKIWVNNATEATPTQTIGPVDNSSWVGVDRVFLGLAAPTSEFATTQGGRDVGFDEFDSRRQTFIN